MSSQGEQIYREGIQDKVGFLTNRSLPLQLDLVINSHWKSKTSLKEQISKIADASRKLESQKK